MVHHIVWFLMAMYFYIVPPHLTHWVSFHGLFIAQREEEGEYAAASHKL